MRNFTITTVWGIPIRINISLVVFLPILAWLIGSGAQIETYVGIINGFAPRAIPLAPLQAGSTPWIIGSLAAVGLFASVTVHELGHAYAARRYGIATESITLWLLGGLASLSSIPREWDRELVIALAGPAGSVLVAIVCYVALLLTPAQVPVLAFVLGWLVVTNITLTVFNLLPAFPMDGGRVLRALLARSQPYAKATRTAARVGTVFALLFAVVGVLSFSPILLLLALFVYGAATSESRTVAIDDLLEGLTVGDVANEVDPVSADETVADFADRMLTDRRTAYPVAEDGQVVGVISLANLSKVAPEERDSVTVGSVATTGVPRFDVTTDAFDALAGLDAGRTSVAIVESAGTPTGVLTREDFTTALRLRREVRVAQ